jgi:tRNA pseudouridine55 synthase
MEGMTIDTLHKGSRLLFDKPLYWTSFDLVNKVRWVLRKATGDRKIKVGHAGTLDPLATGLMIVCTGRLTKSIEGLMGLDKEYVFNMKLGSTTPSFDLETEIDAEFPTDHITDGLIEKTLSEMTGKQMQVPPAFSAKFIDGKRAYELARKGEIREPTPVMVTIMEMELMERKGNELVIRVICSKGTYIRSLARDIGIALGSGAHLIALKRTMIGDFRVEDAVTPENFEKYVTLMKQTPS